MKKNIPDVIIGLSLIAVIVSGYVNVTQADLLKLAGTQWVLIGIVLGIYGLYTKLRTAN